MEKEIYLVDATAFLYRAYFGVRSLTSPTGFPTNAIYGLTTMMLKLINEKKPHAMALIFDSKEKTHRHTLYEAYKAHRPTPPEDFIRQIEPAKQVIEALGVKNIALSGFEADDIMATLALRFAAPNTPVFIVSGDKDMFQIIGANIKMFDPVKNVVLDENYVQNRFLLPPERIHELMAITGDESDGVPGVKGVGEKTAVEILKNYASLNELLSAPEKIKNERIRRLITENAETIRLSDSLVKLYTNVPLAMSYDELILKEPAWEALRADFLKYGFSSLLRMIPTTTGNDKPAEIIVPKEITSLTELSKTTKAQQSSGIVAIKSYSKGTGGFFPERGISFSFDGGISSSVTLNTDAEKKTAIFIDMFQNKDIQKVSYDMKEELHRFDIISFENIHDIMIAAHILNPNRVNRQLKDIAIDYAMDIYNEDITILKLHEILIGKLKESKLYGVYENVEMALLPVLYEIERAGVKLNRERVNELSVKFDEELKTAERRIFFIAGCEFNINSPKQLQEVLFDKLKLSPGKKIKTGYSTDTAVLESLSAKHELPAEIILYRNLAKIKNTYLDTLPGFVNAATGRIHTTFNQCATATGRLSTTNPNLQNIPIKGPWATPLREAFCADDGCIIMSADYSQIELRILAHLSSDLGFIEAFQNNEDIHTQTAADIFNLPALRVTSEHRRAAKSINFGIVYGMSSFGLSEALKISKNDAKNYIESFFTKHPEVSAFITKTIEEAKRLGYTETILGRRREIEGILSSNKAAASQAERLAVNSPIQGSAADIIKLAMINLHKKIKSLGLKTKMVLQVHDELVFEVPESELEMAKGLIKMEMENCYPLKVPLTVDIGVGKNWAEAH
ncbi:DNA polymerase I [Candidatus Magnetomonas plexicatena]|uniref:DNA polymerase I n=1 Tax=Candidatus Magnetomonas plexicatena TaxID=2552947 RepID=UPI0011049EC6|nr:DNA polymerase I [Nitrospirales bacterium LBB_01]